MQTLTITPTWTTTATAEPFVDIVNFGDSYEQRSPSSIRSQRLGFSMAYSNVSSATAAQLRAFLDASGTTLPWLWTAPAPYNEKMRAWVRVGGYTHRYDGFDNESLTFQIKEDLNPAADQCAPVTFDNGAGPLLMATTTAGATIRWTHSTSEVPPAPTDSTGTLYTGGVDVSAGGYWVAVAFLAGSLPSLPSTFHIAAVPGSGFMTEDGAFILTEDGANILPD